MSMNETVTFFSIDKNHIISWRKMKIYMELQYYSLLVLALNQVTCLSLPQEQDEFVMRIIHTNDMHARFQQTSSSSGICMPAEAKAGACYGGFARLATVIREFRNDGFPSLYLDAGDTYDGSTLFTIHKWKIVSKFLNFLNPDTSALGNHEFDNGPSGLIPFLKRAQFPILAANMDVTNESELAPYIKKSIILQVANRQIGVIGYITPSTKTSAAPGNITFYDEISSIQAEVKRLQDQGIKILIALGHSGYIVDQRIAAEIEGLDLVVGGHTHSFLYSGHPLPDAEVAKGPYPTEVIQKSGKKVYVVQAYAYTKYLGVLYVTFNADGEIVKATGSPILLNRDIKEAEDVLQELDYWTLSVQNLMRAPVGYSTVFLDGSMASCRKGECNLGNLITDAMIEYNIRKSPLVTNGTLEWTDAPIAFFNSGNIRASIPKKNDTITKNDIMTVLPYGNLMVKIEVPGQVILELLEKSVYNLRPSDVYLGGTFLQQSGIKVVYNLTQPSGSKVVSVQVLCGKCQVPTYTALEKEKIYKILTIDYLRTGGDGFTMLENYNWSSFDDPIAVIVEDYVKRNSPIYHAIDERIKIVH